MAFLEAITAPDVGIFVNGKDFKATQEMSEERTQEITYQGAFGVDGAAVRNIRHADEGTVTVSAILLKRGVKRGLNDEREVEKWRDFEVQTRRGDVVKTYRGCNWRRIAVRTGLQGSTLDMDISIPGLVRDKRDT